jgi:hypothetical protein
MTSRVLLDEDEYLRLIDQMRISVPQEIKIARQIEAERDSILAAAQEQGEAMIAAAREKAEGLAAEHVVLAQAEERADQVLNNAYSEAAAIRADADAYALEVLERILAQLEGFGHTVQNGIRLLRSGSPVGLPEEEPDVEPDVEPEVVGGEPEDSA